METDILLFPYFLSELLIKLLQTVILSVKVAALSSHWQPGDTDGHLTCSIIVRAGPSHPPQHRAAEIRASHSQSQSDRYRLSGLGAAVHTVAPSVRTLSIVILNKTPICQAVCLSDPGPPASLLSHKDS